MNEKICTDINNEINYITKLLVHYKLTLINVTSKQNLQCSFNYVDMCYIPSLQHD